MGSYANLYILGERVWSSKSIVDPRLTSIFREQDRRVVTRKASEAPWLKPGDLDQDDDYEETAYEYVSTAAYVADRLDVMGFTLEAARQCFENQLASLVDVEEEEGDVPFWADGEREALRVYSFDDWRRDVQAARGQSISLSWSDARLKEYFPTLNHLVGRMDMWGFADDEPDIRFLFRALVSLARPEEFVILEFTELVGGGWYAPDAAITELAAEDIWDTYVANEKIVVLTEGTSDAELLDRTLTVRFPHLVGYYTFPDFEGSRAAGGVGALLATVKAFLSAGIRQRVIALFDNDTAGADAVRILRRSHVPPTMRILQLPPIELGKCYPTIGPQGTLEMDVNGLAGSLELYFGRDVLEMEDGELTPVHWKGYNDALKQYQGELMKKGDLQERYRSVLAAADRNPDAIAQHDWSGMDALMGLIFDAFKHAYEQPSGDAAREGECG